MRSSLEKLWTLLFVALVQLPVAAVVGGLAGIQNGLPFWVMGMAVHHSVRSATILSFRRRLAMWLIAMTVGVITAGVGAIAISLLMQVTAPYALAGQKGGEPSARVTSVFWFVVAIRTTIEWAPMLVAWLVSGVLVRRSPGRRQIAPPSIATRQRSLNRKRQTAVLLLKGVYVVCPLIALATVVWTLFIAHLGLLLSVLVLSIIPPLLSFIGLSAGGAATQIERRHQYPEKV